MAAIECDLHQAIANHRQDDLDALQVKRRLGEYRLAREQRFGDLLRQSHGPLVELIISIRECDQETGVSDPSHEVENPFRRDSSLGPFTAPASRMKG